MRLMKSSFIDVVQWSPQQALLRGQTVYAWKFDETNLSTYTQLIVNESQEAVLFSKGRLIGKFGPGKHTLNTENLPFLRNFFGLPFGGQNPFTAEVWFVNKLAPLNIEWKCGAMMHHDPDYQTMVPLAASGKYGLRVEDAERFLLQLVGTATQFTATQLTEHFKGELDSTTKSAILQCMLARRIGIKTINACLAEISNALQAVMAPFWEKFGFMLTGFYVTSIDVDMAHPTGKQVLEAMSRQSAQVIAGYSYQQERALDIAEQAARNSGGGLLGAVMMTNMMGGGANMLQPSTPLLPGTGTPAASGASTAAASARPVYCSNCSKKYSSDMKFCPHCGDPYLPCPRCGADNDAGAGRCVACGAPLGVSATAEGTCPHCRSAFAGNPTFCPNCGQKVDL